MALTRSFKELVQKRVASDPAFGEAMLREGIDTMLTGDVDTGKAILRDYIKATVGFEKLGEATGTQPKSLIRMFGPRGDPQARNFFSIIGYLQRQAGVELHVTQERGLVATICGGDDRDPRASGSMLGWARSPNLDLG